MVTIRETALPDGSGWKLTVLQAGRAATLAEVLRAWQDDPGFVEKWNGGLARIPALAYRWETPGATRTSASRAFECVVLDAPSLDRTPEPAAFATPLAQSPDAAVVAFANLSGDALMIVFPTNRVGSSLRSSGEFRPARPNGSAGRVLASHRSDRGDSPWRPTSLAEHSRGRRCLAPRPTRFPAQVLPP